MFILLVEDHEDTNRAMATLLRFAGHKVVIAADAHQAIQEFDAHFTGGSPFDCAVIDLGLPDLTGVELMKRLRERHPVPGIALTGSTSPDDVAECLAAGFAVHLPKPVTIEELEGAIQKL